MAKKISLSILLLTFFFLFPLFFFFFSFASPVFAATDCGAVCATAPSCPGGNGYNYQCSGSCPHSRYQRQYWQYNCWAEGTGWNTECSCYTSYSCECDQPAYGAWEDVENCDSWQECSLTPVGGSHCVCRENCLATPINPSPSNGEQDAKLPVTFSWSPVNGANSYRYKIGSLPEDYTALTQITVGDCKLQSNADYSWQVRACCSSNGTNCGPWSGNWSFKTSPAPELISPIKDATDTPLPVALNWCNVSGSQSYCLKGYKDGGLHFPFIIEKEDDVLQPQFLDESLFFTKDTTYEWEIATCFEKQGIHCGTSCTNAQDCSVCGDFSQRWEFTTIGELSPPGLVAPFYDLAKPDEIPVINAQNSISWKYVKGVRSYDYEIKKDGAVIPIPDSYLAYIGSTSLSIAFSTIWDFLEFDKIYTWRVKTCWDEKGEDCGEEWSAEWKFKTTGAKPGALEADVTIIPVKLNWGDVPGAASYNFEVASDSGFGNIVIPENQRSAKNSEATVDYPNLHQDTLYYWRVKTCAKENGEVCGQWSDSQNFKTFRLAKPTNPVPADGGEFYTYEHSLKWDATPGAKFYRYKIDYGGTEKIPLTVVSVNSAFVPTEQLELGDYSWYVLACLDKDCNEIGDQSGPWHFTLAEQLPPTMGSGLVPCGRYVNVNDPYGIDERQSCQFSHIFLLLRNIIDFVLWKVGLIVLALLVMATGFVFYFSMGAPKTMNKVKSILKSAGTGYAIVFVSWTLIDLILKILGYKVGLPWWQLQF